MALAVIVVTGTAVRLTASGLGCSDWPTCEEGQLIADFSFHPMIEFVNRVFTGFVAVAVIVAVLASLFRKPRRRDLTLLSWGLVAGVIGQIALGAVTVLTHLNPWVVMSHFLLSMVLVANATVLHARAGYDPVPPERAGRWYRWPITLLTTAAITAGTLVTGSGPHAGSEDGDPIERMPFDVPNVARIHGGIVIALVAGCDRRYVAPQQDQRPTSGTVARATCAVVADPASRHRLYPILHRCSRASCWFPHRWSHPHLDRCVVVSPGYVART